MVFKFKKDKYKTARGTYSRLLELRCRECNKKIVIYQKDGPGNLRRLYFDRIIAPERLIKNKTLRCSHCNEMLGTSYTYKKEKRKAFKLYQDALLKKVIRMKDI